MKRRCKNCYFLKEVTRIGEPIYLCMRRSIPFRIGIWRMFFGCEDNWPRKETPKNVLTIEELFTLKEDEIVFINSDIPARFIIAGCTDSICTFEVFGSEIPLILHKSNYGVTWYAARKEIVK